MLHSMEVEKFFDNEYKAWLIQLKSKIRSTQIKAAVAVNSALINFYWDLGKMIVEKQSQTQWGDKLIAQLAKDLKAEFPEMQGLSNHNLIYCKQFYSFYQSISLIVQQPVAQLESSQLKDGQTNLPNAPFGQQAVAQLVTLIGKQPIDQLPWSHNILIFTKSENIKEAEFYLQQTVENNWSRDTLALQIKSDLYKRQGKSINNFKATLPNPVSELAEQTLKDPYIFDFMTMALPYKEKDIENQLIKHITKFLLELGKRFAFVGQQFHLEIAENDYYIDLLFYHARLKCYVVIELKNTKFIIEYAGKLNFYLSTVDSLVKQDDDKPTIGMLLCRDKNNIEAEFALRDINKAYGCNRISINRNFT